MLGTADGRVEIFADAVLATPCKAGRIGPDDLHFPVLPLHVQGYAHLLGAAGRKSGVLAGPDGRDLASHEPEAFFDISKRLETPDVDEAAPLHALPHEHEVVPVHALHEMLGRIDDQDVVQAFAQIAHKGPRQ